MSNSICRFVPAQSAKCSLETVYFVYETEFHKLKQPFYHATFRVGLVTRGTARLRLEENIFSLKKGDLYFVPPSLKYTMDGDGDFAYMYINFAGERAYELLKKCSIDVHNPVFHGHERLIEFWQSCIRKIDRFNAAILTESVLLYTFSFLGPEMGNPPRTEHIQPVLESVLIYMDNHFTDADLSLRKVADIFSYTSKYLSRLFKKSVGVNFNAYLTELRVAYAVKCMENGMRSVTEIAHACGYYDALYFSKVFKRVKGETPLAFMKQRGL